MSSAYSRDRAANRTRFATVSVTTPESFADYPQSVTERRSDEDGNAAKWTPRDALIAVLRDLDGGVIDPDALVICYRHKTGPGKTSSHYANSSPDVHTTLGLLAFAQHKIIESGR